MKLLMIFLGVVVGIIIFLGIIALVIYGNLKKAFNKLGFQVNNFNDFTNEMNKIKQEDSERARSISGMTTLLLPTIRGDFPDFNENELFVKCESSLRKVFNALEQKDKSYVDDLPLIKTSTSNIIDDYLDAKISVHYDDIEFHKFAIYQYEKKDGVATITLSTSVEYYYQKIKDGKEIEGNTKTKKQTRYQCDFIYIYDESKVDTNAKALAINCPNCGATIKVLGHKYCEYCGTRIREVNLKSWEFSSYEEF